MKFSNRFGKLVLFAATAQMVSVGSANAAGFEKGIMWGGRSAGVGGIATPYMTGAQALYFNPAGLANDKEGQDVSLNLSPTFPTFNGPINNENTQETSKSTTLIPGSLLYSRTLNDKVGVGIGYFASGGSNATYENVGFPLLNNPTATVTTKTDLAVTEASLGAGYKVSEDLKVGLAWRVTMAKAEFAVAQRDPTSSNVLNAQLSDLKATDFTGFRLGAQYKINETTRLGFNYRSEVNLKADGNVGGKINAYGAPATIPLVNNSASVKTTFPMQANLGIMHEYPEWRALADVSWTQYSRVKDIEIEGKVQRADNNTVIRDRSAVPLDWQDEIQARLGGEYLGVSWPIRFGYAYTGQVTNKDKARATFVPPAAAHTLTVGTGQIFNVMENALQFDVAGEYTMASADAGTAPAGNTTNDFRSGKYEVNSYSVHMGLTYAF